MNSNDLGQQHPVLGRERPSPSPCHRCTGIPTLVGNIVEAIDFLTMTRRQEGGAGSPEYFINQHGLDLMHSDLLQSLVWVLERIRSTACKVDAVHSGFPNKQLPQPEISPSGQQVSGRAKRRLGVSRYGTEVILSGPCPHSPDSQMLEGLEMIASGQDHDGNFLGESPSQPSFPIASLSGTISEIAESTQASLAKDTLPRPSPIDRTPNVLSPIVSITPRTAPPLSHFQDTRQSTLREPLSSETIQIEHDSLSSALSQAQARVAILGRKCQAYEAEVSSFTKERSVLTAQIKSLESHLAEVQQSRDEARRQSAAKGAQYVDIMAMASKIQAQGDLDAKKWRAEKEEWLQERQSLVQRLAVLQHGKETLSNERRD